MVKVVAKTASPISLVPSRAAVTGSLPMSECRTIFSRTTIASSISRPILSDSASKVIILMLKPKIQINVRVPRRAIGNVMPVMAVERNEPKNSRTIKTARAAPSIMVRATSVMLLRMPLDESTTTFAVVPSGNCFSISAKVS